MKGISYNTNKYEENYTRGIKNNNNNKLRQKNTTKTKTRSEMCVYYEETSNNMKCERKNFLSI